LFRRVLDITGLSELFGLTDAEVRATAVESEASGT
jgi:hypothetical protein